jgi:uncharacterized LabA/DUF88 family protein
MGISIVSSGVTPHYQRMMIFVDGTNFLMELSKELSKIKKVNFRADKPPSVVLKISAEMIDPLCRGDGIVKIRRYWFASYKGNDEDCSRLAKELRKNDFEPVLFRKKKGKEKGVDIALAKEMLVNSFNQNFDIALLIAGDEDYVELVTEVKRYGPVIWGAFFTRGLSEKLKIVFDRFIDIGEYNRDRFNSETYRTYIDTLSKSCVTQKSLSKNENT